MKIIMIAVGALAALLIFPLFMDAQIPDQLQLRQNTSVRPGLGAEYLNITIGWDEGAFTSKLKTYLFCLNTEFEIMDGTSFNIILGYSLSDFNGIIFRQLPFSIEVGVGNIEGFLFGVEGDQRILYLSQYEIVLHGKFVYYYGFKNEWAVPTLNVEGKVFGSPSWMLGQIGPTVRYEGLNFVVPYVRFLYSQIWGRFNMDQEIQDLSGTESKKINGLSHFTLSAGVEYELLNNLSINGEITFMPFNGGVDWGGMVLLRYAFQSGPRRNR
jgi:hypothetical protein